MKSPYHAAMALALLLACLPSLFAGTTLNWYLRPSGITQDLKGVDYGNGKYLVVGSDGSGNVVLGSLDGITWSALTPPATSEGLCRVAFGTNLFVLATRTQLWHSVDGNVWTPAALPTEAILRTVRFVNNAFYALGGSANIFRSPNGTSWTSQTSEPDYGAYLEDIAWGASAGVAVGKANSSTILIKRSSDNGLTWNTVSNSLDNALFSVAYGNGLFVAVGGSGEFHGLIMTSPNGLDWSIQTQTYEFTLRRVLFAEGLFAIVGDAGTVLLSSNGVDWTRQWEQTSPVTSKILRDADCVQGRFLAVGDDGTIVQSAPANPPLGPSVYANGARTSVTVAAGETVQVAVSLYAGAYAGTPADWWGVAIPENGSNWYYLNSALQWIEFPAGNLDACQPASTGALITLDTPVTILPATVLAAGTYSIYFAVTEATGILRPEAPMLSDRVTITVE
jgi:hypothetical protein